MKKLLVLALASFGVLSLSGCDLINKAKESITGEKEMKYQEFVDYWRDNGEKYSYTSALESDRSVSPKVQKSYSKDAEKHSWINVSHIDVDGTDLVINLEKYFDAYYYVEKTLKTSFAGKDLDETFRFAENTKDNTYKVSYKSNNSDEALEVVFDKDGLMSTMKGKGSSKELGTLTVDYVITYQK